VIWLGVVLIAAIVLINNRPVSNCPLCAWAIDGQCGHPTASQVPEAAEIQMGAWRCPWRELGPTRQEVTALDALDTCERCGRLPRIESRELYRQDREEYGAVCPRCGWQTAWHCSVEEAVAAWNGKQRRWPVGRRTMDERA
jgi:DNA-directed RNA polymerase subunit RPC12/RpoP